MCKGPLVCGYASLPFGSAGLSPWPPEAEGTHLMGGVVVVGGGGKGRGGGRLERKLSWKWFRPQSPHPVGGSIKGPGCHNPQS